MDNEYFITYDGELYHWGIKGMKWGVRRYQNADGSLTAAGRKRYSNPDGTLNEKGKKYYAEQEARLKKERQAIMAQKRLDAKLGKLDAQRKANEELRNGVKKTDGKSTEATQNKFEGERIADISTEELIKRNNRMIQEANYKQNMEKLGFVVTDGRPKSEIDYKIEELKKQKELLGLQKDIRDLTPKKESAAKKIAEKLFDKVILPAASDYGKKYIESIFSKEAVDAAKKVASDAAKKAEKETAKQEKKAEKKAAKAEKSEAKESAKQEKKKTTSKAFDKDPGTDDSRKVYEGSVEGVGTSSRKRNDSDSSYSSSNTVFDSDKVYRGSDGVYRYSDTPVTSIANTRNTSSGSAYVNRYGTVRIAGLLPDPKDRDD